MDFGGVCVAALLYCEHVRALGDINSIFHIDASAFPIATSLGMPLPIDRWPIDKREQPHLN